MRWNWALCSLLALSLETSGVVLARASSAPQGPPPPAAEQGGWDAPPPEFREVQRQGFRDGIEGARKDFDNHRPANVRNRDEYRHPHVDPSVRHDYREGFRRGYDVAWQHLTGHPAEQRPPA
jgi:hypothetical protein